MAIAVRASLAAVAVTVAVVAVGIPLLDRDGDQDPGTTTAPTSPSTAPAPRSTIGLAVERAQFCDLVSDEDLTDALGGDVADATSYGDGDRARVAGGGGRRDVAHEFACTWRASDGTTAEAWVFAPPVTISRSRSLRRSARRADGCREVPGAPDFGAGSVTLVCGDGAAAEASQRGLFGDAWLTCSLTAGESGADDLVARTGDWCTAVAVAAAAKMTN